MNQQPMRILHLHSSFSLGGKEARAVRLMNAFGKRAQHVILSATADALGARDAIAPGIAADFPNDAPSLEGKPAPGRYWRLAHYFQQFDLLLSYNWGSMDAVMAHRLLSPIMRLPPIIHHEDGFNADESERLNPKRNAFRRLGLGTADAVVVPSYRLEQIARTIWKQGDRVQRISNGIALRHYSVDALTDPLPGLVRHDGQVIVGTIAGLRAVKDLPLLVRAVAQTPTHVHLVIAGEGPEREAILAEAARCGIADRVHLIGFVAQPARIVRHFDMMALSSLSEQQPIAVMEGMAAALPIIAPQVGDVADMVAPSNRPYIVDRDAGPLAGAIKALVDDPARRAVIGADNRVRAAAEFDENQMIGRYARLYARAAKRDADFLIA